MREEEIEKTTYPDWWRGVKKNHVGIQQSLYLCSFDTETYYGECFALGFFDGTTYRQFYGLKENYLERFLECLFSLPLAKGQIGVCAAHYLKFDLGVLLWPLFKPRKKQREKSPKELSFSLIKYKCTIKAVVGKPCFAIIIRGRKVYHLIDTWGFYNTSLAHALKVLGTKIQKEEKPHDLGKRIIPEREVTPYLQSDVRGCYLLLGYVVDLHREYRTRICVSLPQLAGRIFRHAYLQKDFVRLPGQVLLGALLSYHGGKNTFVGRAGWYQSVYDLDIRSAFPEAMRQLPNFENGEWIKTKNLKEALKNEHGIYKISGYVQVCPWGSLFDHGFKKLAGNFERIWVTGYELIEAVRSGEAKISLCSGWFFRGGHKNSSAFKRFTDDFFRLKETTTNPTNRSFYKLILNSLYGKFIQRTEKEDNTKEVGSMFDPAIASLITGFVRAKVHRLEHKYKSLHTATDGILTKRKPDPKDLGDGLGQLKQENFGPCLIIRNKLYLHYDKNGDLFKKGLHGYQGDPKQLLELWNKKKSEYKIERLVNWSEAFHLDLPPGFPLSKSMKLNYAKPTKSVKVTSR